MKYHGLGTSFLCGYTQFIGDDFIANFNNLIDMGFSYVRLAIRWDWIEKEKDNFDFSLYEKLLTIADERNVEILLAIGITSPGWPEYFYPDWFDLNHFSQQLTSDDLQGEESTYVLRMVSRTVQTLLHHPCIKSIQVENEALITFGPENLALTEDFLKKEIDTVRAITDCPILISTPFLYPFSFFVNIYERGNQNLKFAMDNADIVGIHFYPNVPKYLFGQKFILKASFIDWWYAHKKLQKIGKPVWVTELQAEPWESKPEVFSGNFNRSSVTNTDLRRSIQRLHDMDINRIYLWNGEYLLSELAMGKHIVTERIT